MRIGSLILSYSRRGEGVKPFAVYCMKCQSECDTYGANVAHTNKGNCSDENGFGSGDGGMSLGIGVFVMLGIGSFGGLEERDGVFVILMGVIILALGKICDLLVEIRDK